MVDSSVSTKKGAKKHSYIADFKKHVVELYDGPEVKNYAKGGLHFLSRETRWRQY